MNFLHIILPTKRMMETYIQMIRKYYGMEQHTFCVLGDVPKSEIELLKYGNFIIINEKNLIKKSIKVFNILSKYDHIIWHGLVVKPKLAMFLFTFRKFLRKSTWVIWGIDLYSWRRENNGLKNRCINYINWTIRNLIKNVVAIFPSDINNYRKNFSNGASISYAPYPISESGFVQLDNKQDDIPIRQNGETWILVGNNANSFNRHLDILNVLEKYKNEKVKVFIPLSYGNDWHNKVSDYKKIVEDRAIEIFGNKNVIVLKNLMDNKTYNKFLCQMDVIVIATNRQNALGNILKVLYSGGKAFLSKENALYSYFNSCGIMVECFEDIDSMGFSDFIRKNNNINLKRWMVDNYYPSKNVLYWKRHFEKICNTELVLKHNDNNVDTSDILRSIKSQANILEKKNYINLFEYTYSKNLVKKYSGLNDLVFVGTDDSIIKILSILFYENRKSLKYKIVGFIDEKMTDLGDIAHGYNTVGTIDNYENKENDRFIIFCDDTFKRETYYRKILEKKGVLYNIILDNVCIGSNFKYEDSIYIGRNSIIGYNCSFGKCVKVGNNVVIGSNCKIGDFVNIGDNCVIKSNSVVDDFVSIDYYTKKEG